VTCIVDFVLKLRDEKRLSAFTTRIKPFFERQNRVVYLQYRGDRFYGHLNDGLPVIMLIYQFSVFSDFFLLFHPLSFVQYFNVAYNTFFSLLTQPRQQACLHAVAARLRAGGVFAIEAFVPEVDASPTSSVSVRSVAADRVVLSVSTADPERQLAEGQYVDITETGGVRLRPWSIRWATPAQLDEMAAEAGLRLTDRGSGFDRAPFGPDSARHVSVYRQE
jgi:hypothetical protein